ncbi:uncharacterized protein V1510DRAFT_405637 [Dipodascopsis tothii]|uniref:uncharacterized protein n=1 Tax=Dipodascopsis tothii TaxID=44089 RepID=UPI0034CE785A
MGTCDLQDLVMAADPVVTKPTLFKGQLVEYYYLERPRDSKDSDETVVMRTTTGELYISHDHGNSWDQLTSDSNLNIVSVYPHPYNSDYLYLITDTNQLVVSTDRGQTVNVIKLPAPHTSGYTAYLTFHRTKTDWIIWHGDGQCDGQPCAIAYYSQNNGKVWAKLYENVRACQFVGGLQKPTDDNLIFCSHLLTLPNSDVRVEELVSTHDFFKHSVTHFDNIIGYASLDDFMVVAAIGPNRRTLKADVSIDGETFAEVQFPANFDVFYQQAYTFLDTSTKAVFIHVTTNTHSGSEYGTILKSNSNGTSYVVSLEYVNRNYVGFVDFEKMQGMEGIALVNVVSNPEESREGALKKLRTQITFNDGGQWHYLMPPPVDSENKKYDCTGSIDQCSLNLHGFTERRNDKSYSSASAVGLMVGLGNVGEYMTTRDMADTFLTRDGGVTWVEIKKGRYIWEYGDQGAIIVLVKDGEATNVLEYTLDEGMTWHSFSFYDEPLVVSDISTVPSDTSRKFLIFAKAPATNGEQYITISVDMTGTLTRKCVLNPKRPSSDDFQLWEPNLPSNQEGCLFGHKVQYYRKIPQKDCYIGEEISQPHAILTNCLCSREDFECDFNYVRANDGSCQLVSGLSPPDHSQSCAAPGTIEYWEPTGYRRIPLSTCSGGHELDKVTPKPCPGHESDFDRRHSGLRGFSLFLVIILPFVLVGIITYIVWQRFYGRYGQIRLDLDNDLDPAYDSSVLRYPILIFSAMATTIGSLPEIVKSIYSRWSGRSLRPSRLYRPRTGIDSFPLDSRTSTRSYRYSPVVVEDAVGNDAELLGSDEDDEDDENQGIPAPAHS